LTEKSNSQGKNQELMRLLDERSRERETIALSEARARLVIGANDLQQETDR
jgi:hypothetical protein